MFPKIGVFPPKSSILIGIPIINHPFWGTTIFGNTHIYNYIFMCVYIYICVCGPFLNTRFVSQCSLLVMKTRHLFEKTKELQDFLACLKGG